MSSSIYAVATKKKVIVSAGSAHSLIEIEAETVNQFLKNYYKGDYTCTGDVSPPSRGLERYAVKFNRNENTYGFTNDGTPIGIERDTLLPTGQGKAGKVSYDFSVNLTMKKVDAGAGVAVGDIDQVLQEMIADFDPAVVAEEASVEVPSLSESEIDIALAENLSSAQILALTLKEIIT